MCCCYMSVPAAPSPVNSPTGFLADAVWRLSAPSNITLLLQPYQCLCYIALLVSLKLNESGLRMTRIARRRASAPTMTSRLGGMAPGLSLAATPISRSAHAWNCLVCCGRLRQTLTRGDNP
jgi:hypothetical protein